MRTVMVFVSEKQTMIAAASCKASSSPPAHNAGVEHHWHLLGVLQLWQTIFPALLWHVLLNSIIIYNGSCRFFLETQLPSWEL
jgi:hypothetical protein